MSRSSRATSSGSRACARSRPSSGLTRNTRSTACGAEIGALFAPQAQFTFDGQVRQGQTMTGPEQIAAFLRTRYGGGPRRASSPATPG
jgi:hypothetical protein